MVTIKEILEKNNINTEKITNPILEMEFDYNTENITCKQNETETIITYKETVDITTTNSIPNTTVNLKTEININFKDIPVRIIKLLNEDNEEITKYWDNKYLSTKIMTITYYSNNNLIGGKTYNLLGGIING